MTLKPEHLTDEQRKILCEVALTYRRARRAEGATLAELARSYNASKSTISRLSDALYQSESV
jgi:hypothetical protein